MKTEAQIRECVAKIEKRLEKLEKRKRDLCDECEIGDYSYQRLDGSINTNTTLLNYLRWILDEQEELAI